jgi:hypothetical protein
MCSRVGIPAGSPREGNAWSYVNKAIAIMKPQKGENSRNIEPMPRKDRQ